MNNTFIQDLPLHLSRLSGKDAKINSYRQVCGGDINTTYIIDTNEKKYFLKINNVNGSDMFQKEYNGLMLLRNKTRLKIPEPLGCVASEQNCYLIMECLEKDAPQTDTWKILGEGLAALHQCTQPQFGLEEDNYIGSLAQSNSLQNSWAEFYAAQQILPLFQKAFDNGYCTANDVKQAEMICTKLTDIFPKEPPALLHGDLWNGNIMACANNEAAIFDPAVYYGHREMDIAMTLLFDGFDLSFYHHYNNAYPLQNGWQNRTDLCQLYPLLVHLTLFGAGYYAQVKNVLRKYK